MGACSSRAADRAEQRKKNWSRTGLIGLKGAGLKARKGRADGTRCRRRRAHAALAPAPLRHGGRPADVGSADVPLQASPRPPRQPLPPARPQALPPDALAALPAAVSLALARNRLPALPAELAGAARLARLDARDNGLAGPDALAPAARLPALKWLAVTGNRGLGALPPLDLPCLEELDAARCGLAAGPGPACRLPALTTLCLAGNHLATFEPGDWPALKALDLSDNQLTSLPGSLCRLTGLRVLRLDGNAGLATLPAGLLSRSVGDGGGRSGRIGLQGGWVNMPESLASGGGLGQTSPTPPSPPACLTCTRWAWTVRA